MMKYNFENLDIDGVSVEEAMTALQTWKDENPDAVKDVINLIYDGDSTYLEITFERPMTEKELEDYEQTIAAQARSLEQYERETYERLKAKFEGN
jgi:hypothetical protein